MQSDVFHIEVWCWALVPRWIDVPDGCERTQPESINAAGVEFFEKKVRPVLVEHCYTCHSHAGGKMRGGLALDSRSGWEKGGSSGPAVVPGKPDESLLIQAVRHTQADLTMPPKKKLSDAEIGILIEWVRQGRPIRASWPRSPSPRNGGRSRRSSSLQCLGRVRDIRSTRSFRLGCARSNCASPEADRRTLIRRLTFDLHGLPPTPEEVEAFVANRDPQAYEQLVDRLLASPRYGERWARHWLDVIRYGESEGYSSDGVRPNSWRYRDYVIDAFNSDKPYDRFIQEQIAADVLFPDDGMLMAALGFLAAGPTNTTDSYSIRDEFVNATMSTFVSSTAHCARCHNHKFDPISQEDYYALQAIFAGVRRDDVEVDGFRAVRAKWTALKAAAVKGDKDTLVTSENKALIANWEKSVAAKSPPWQLLQPTTAVAASGTVIEHRKDGSLFIAKRWRTATPTLSPFPALSISHAFCASSSWPMPNFLTAALVWLMTGRFR